MAKDHSELQSRMESMLNESGFQSELAQVRAKATLQSIGELRHPPKWSYVAKRFSRNSVAALYAFETATLTDPDYAAREKKKARQIAFAWENLAKLGEGVTRSSALLNAALANELAGFQANATYLAKKFLPEPNLNSRADAQSLVAFFIQRRLIVTIHLAEHLLENPPSPDSPIETLSLELGEVILADGLSKACRYFLGGNYSVYAEAEMLLDEAVKVFGLLSAPFQYNIAYGVRSVLPLMMQRSTWSQLEVHARDSELWKRYLTLLARPINRGVTELWPSQLSILKTGFLGSDESSVIRLPTSGGKTRIAEMAIIDTFQRHPESKCVFVAPYRALASEVERTLGSILNDLGFRISTVVGSYETDEFEEHLFNSADLLIVTPEKLDLLLRIHPSIADQVRLIVLDEVHILDDANRGIKFELLINRLQQKLTASRFLLMSAVIPDSTLEEFALWLAGSPDRSMKSDWRPTIRRLARFVWRGSTGTIQFKRDGEIPNLDTFVPGAIQRREYSWINPDTGRKWTRKYPNATKQETAAELAYVFSEQGPVLVFCTQPNWVEGVCHALFKKSIGYRKNSEESIPARFSNVPPTRSYELAREWLGIDHFATQALSHGIAPHHGRLPNIVREAIEDDCRRGHYKVIIATNTLAQGVNLPVRTVIMHSTWRVDAEGQRTRIPVRDYQNISGRAGRAGMETEGLVVHIILNQQDRQDFNHFSNPENLEPVSGALFQLLQQIVSDRFSEESLELAAERLDPEILAIAVEEDLGDLDSDEWLTSLENTFAANRGNAQTETRKSLIASARLSAEKLFGRVPDPSRRKIYAQTGLSSSSCLTLSQFVDTHEDVLRTLLLGAVYDDLEELNRLVIEASLPLSEAQTNTGFPGDVEALLGLWVTGRPINEISKQVLEPTDSEEQLTRYIEELFGYRLPWIVSALFRISKGSLGIQDEETSEYIRYYPSMVKHGLPDPLASWAMSAGISTRRVARRLADAFQEEFSNEPTHEDFLAWLSILSDDALRQDYGLSGFALNELRYKLGRMVTNPMLRPLRPLHKLFPMLAEVVGVKYENRIMAARRVRQADKLELRRDYENFEDANAIAVHHEFGQIGFLPRSLAQRLAPEIDAGSIIEATAVENTLKENFAPIAQLSLV